MVDEIFLDKPNYTEASRFETKSDEPTSLRKSLIKGREISLLSRFVTGIANIYHFCVNYLLNTQEVTPSYSTEREAPKKVSFSNQLIQGPSKGPAPADQPGSIPAKRITKPLPIPPRQRSVSAPAATRVMKP